jgi:hypothetical protein
MAVTAARRETVRVKGYRDLLRALQTADKETKREVRSTLRKVGELVRVDATGKLMDEAPKSALGYRVRVRQRGVEVEQSLRKTTGLHPEWGGYQMRHALEPALDENEEATVRAMEHALDVVCAHFNHGGLV